MGRGDRVDRVKGVRGARGQLPDSRRGAKHRQRRPWGALQSVCDGLTAVPCTRTACKSIMNVNGDRESKLKTKTLSKHAKASFLQEKW